MLFRSRKITELHFDVPKEYSGKERLISYFYMFSKVSDNVTPQVIDYGTRDQYGVININLATDKGVIKKVNTYVNGIKVSENFYYASTKHDAGYRLFATDIICLGSVFDCDWQGIPKLQQYLVPTTYKMPPDTVEFSGDTAIIETSGQVTLTPDVKGLFFDIDCIFCGVMFAFLLLFVVNV